jgi:hypothetical protein
VVLTALLFWRARHVLRSAIIAHDVGVPASGHGVAHG